MSTETSTPKPPKKGTVAAANLRIEELENSANQRIEELEGRIKEMQQAKSKECCSKQNTVLPEFGQVKPWDRTFIVEGRVTYARPGIVLPKGVKPHGYVNSRIPVNAGDEMPSLKAIGLILAEAAADKYPGGQSVVLCNFFEIPLQWKNDMP